MCGLSSEGGNVVCIAAKPVPSKVVLSSMEPSYGCRSPYSCTSATQGIPKGYSREQQALNTGATPEQHARNRLAGGVHYARAEAVVPVQIGKRSPRDTQGILKGTTGSQHRSNTGATRSQQARRRRALRPGRSSRARAMRSFPAVPAANLPTRL